LKASDVFKRIVELSWKNGEPASYSSTGSTRKPHPAYRPIESTNPCGEQPLLPYESCNLGSINLAHMVTAQNGKPEINYLKLGNTIRTAIRFLDNVIEVNNYPLPEIAKMTRNNRKVGLGVMGSPICSSSSASRIIRTRRHRGRRGHEIRAGRVPES